MSAPNAKVEIQVLRKPDLDPSLDSNWDLLETAYSSTIPGTWNAASPDPVYLLSRNVTPVPTAAEVQRWPLGKMVKLRVVQKFQADAAPRLVHFEDANYLSCYYQHAHKSWQTYMAECGSPFPTISVLSTALNPADASTGVNVYNYLGKKGDATETATALYYATAGLPTTLANFKQTYGFPTNEVTAVYYNSADLGFGREMHCKSFDVLLGTGLLDKGVACYVNNYGNSVGQAAFPAVPSSALSLAHGGVGQFATVAMVYTPPNLLPNAIKFVVYGPDGTRSNIAPLDSTGAHKSVPHNCLACHGLNSSAGLGGTSVIAVSTAARFLPFDPYSFTYRSQNDFDLQRENFRKLNALVALTPLSPETSRYIKGLYGGKDPSDPTAVSVSDFVPPAWNTSKEDRIVYEGVIRPHCRGCHMTATSTSYDFDSPADLAPNYIHTVPCSADHRMPHAEQTLRNFWNSSARSVLAQRYSLSNHCSP
ncbi:hypothetical protein OWM54_15580 [Myxococcus sp. MISCRS1]|uniref:hypothetical protein n=1 Tax=Myxococcus sp. MISCRS1 TaxID=2996786 RepID=UPI00226E61F4|nr:hypothetical protein [Myxococcus sp. MISCRS1]MCY0998558.1 hypothetical protein [Myxococcus sp. MISCRS1]